MIITMCIREHIPCLQYKLSITLYGEAEMNWLLSAKYAYIYTNLRVELEWIIEVSDYNTEIKVKS